MTERGEKNSGRVGSHKKRSTENTTRILRKILTPGHIRIRKASGQKWKENFETTEWSEAKLWKKEGKKKAKISSRAV